MIKDATVIFKSNEAWNLIEANAKKAMLTNTIWCSLIEIASYKLIEVTDNYLLIQRLDGGKEQKLTKGKIVKAAEKLLEAGGKIKRRTLISPTVAEETAFVFFHPLLEWSEDREYIHIRDLE